MRNSRELGASLRQSNEEEANFFNTKRPTQRSGSQRGLQHQQFFNDQNSPQGQEQLKMSNKGQRLGQNNGNKPKVDRGNRRKHGEEEEELSSLSGFTASDNEEHDDLKFKIHSKTTKNVHLHSDDEEEWDQENRDIVLNPKEDFNEKFQQYEMLRKKNAEEKRQREILAAQNPDNVQNIPLKRPHSSHGPMKNSENTLSGTFALRQKENLYPERPQTANVKFHEEAYETKTAFRPIYTKPILQTMIEKKVFNYKDKTFKTIPKKSDPVSRINAFKNEWNKTKFLKNNPKMKEGRKLNLAERNQTSKPEFIFHRYQAKYTFD